MFNFSILSLPKLFLGDNGSLLLGFIFAILIYLSNQKLVHPILLAWSISIFVYEFLSINLVRIKNKKDPFTAGQVISSFVLQKNNSMLLTNFLMCFINIFLFLLVIFFINFIAQQFLYSYLYFL